MSKQEKIDEIVDTVLQGAHAQVVNGVTYFFAEGGWHSGARELDELVVGIERSTTRSDRAEVRDLVGLLAPKGAFAPPRYIAFHNGVLDVETMAFSDASPDLIVPNQIPWDWLPGASSTEVEAYLDSTAGGDQDALARIEEMLGACLYRGKLSAMFVVVGMAPVPEGDASNGKSTLIELCFSLVGDGNCIPMDVQVFGMRFAAADIAGKLVVGSTDAPSEKPDSVSLSILKRIVTCDRIESDTKNGARVYFKPYATVILGANRVPPFIDDAGLKRRPVVVPLKGKFPRNGPDPLETLVTDEHMPALIVHAVAGLRRLLENGPAPCADGDRALAGIIAMSSTVEQWVDDEGLEPAALNGEPCTKTYQRYASWCGSSGERPIKRSEFDQELCKRWPGLRSERCRFNGQPTTKRWIHAATTGTAPVK